MRNQAKTFGGKEDPGFSQTHWSHFTVRSSGDCFIFKIQKYVQLKWRNNEHLLPATLQSCDSDDCRRGWGGWNNNPIYCIWWAAEVRWVHTEMTEGNDWHYRSGSITKLVSWKQRTSETFICRSTWQTIKRKQTQSSCLPGLALPDKTLI